MGLCERLTGLRDCLIAEDPNPEYSTLDLMHRRRRGGRLSLASASRGRHQAAVETLGECHGMKPNVVLWCPAPSAQTS